MTCIHAERGRDRSDCLNYHSLPLRSHRDIKHGSLLERASAPGRAGLGVESPAVALAASAAAAPGAPAAAGAKARSTLAALASQFRGVTLVELVSWFRRGEGWLLNN